MPVSDNNKEREIRKEFSCQKPNIQRQAPGAQNTLAKGTHWSWSSGSPKRGKIFKPRNWMKGIFWQLLLTIAKGVAFSLFFSWDKEGERTPKERSWDCHPALTPSVVHTWKQRFSHLGQPEWSAELVKTCWAQTPGCLTQEVWMWPRNLHF